MSGDDVSERLPTDPARWAESLIEKRERHRQRSMPYRVGFAIVGVAVLLFGIVTIPLPGPGWATVFVGLGMLALEFEWASKLALLVLAGLRWFWERWAVAPAWQRAIAVVGLLVIAAFAISLSATLIGSPDFVPKLW
jgi:uncharacterized protein (TIGR02611 family)